MTEVYAYYTDATKQLLEKHIKESIEAFKSNIKYTKIWEYYVNISEYDEKTVEKWMKFTITFHDIGKIFYQKNFRENFGRLSFVGHEFFSTFLADKFLNIWLDKDVENRTTEYIDFRWVVCASILYHHHAMGLKGREKLSEIKVCEENEFNEIVETVSKILKSYLKDFENEVIDSFANELKKQNLKKSGRYLILDQKAVTDIFRCVDELNKKIWENFVSASKFRKRMILSTNLLILSDYKGSESRGTKPTRFGEILNEFIKLYKLDYIK